MRRRDLLRMTAILGVGGGLPALTTRAAGAAGSVAERDPDLVIQLRAVRRRVPILDGPRTPVWAYRARVLRGDSSAVVPIPGSYLGPVFRFRRGQRVRIELRNRLPQPTIVHWHGLHVPAGMDGHPSTVIGSGGRFDYEFDVLDRAGTYLYHPHPHGLTGQQVYAGLMGLVLVSDGEEDALGLPGDDNDLPLVIQDRRFDSRNRLAYTGHGFGNGMGMQGGGGILGDRILVNGRYGQDLRVRREPYRLRLVNGCNARILKLAWSDGTPMRVVATDGGLLSRAVERPYLTLSPGERVEVWVDFSSWPESAEPRLISKRFDAGAFGGGSHGPWEGHDVGMGERFEVAAFRLEPGAGAGVSPVALGSFQHWRPQDAVNESSPRRWAFEGRFGAWTINGRTFEMNEVAADERVEAETLEVWDLENPSGFGPGAMMSMPHPVHIHGAPFQVVDRVISARSRRAWSTVSRGYVDEGLKDTVLLMPGERVRILKAFPDFTGTYVIHCHNLEHADMGMMRNFRID